MNQETGKFPCHYGLLHFMFATTAEHANALFRYDGAFAAASPTSGALDGFSGLWPPCFCFPGVCPQTVVLPCVSGVESVMSLGEPLAAAINSGGVPAKHDKYIMNFFQFTGWIVGAVVGKHTVP